MCASCADAEDRVDLWAFDLDAGAVAGGAHLLSSDERARASRFRDARDRDRFVVGRAALRRLLAECTSSRPEALVFRYGSRGKPMLHGPYGARGLHFNLAHSGPLALIGISRAQPLGVDLERIVAFDDMMSVARHHFSPAEVSALTAHGPVSPSAFFQCWTRKEAFIKAIGEGLAFGLDQFDVSVAAEGEPGLLRLHGSTEAAARWSVPSILPAPGYVAAVAIELVRVRVRCMQWDLLTAPVIPVEPA